MRTSGRKHRTVKRRRAVDTAKVRHWMNARSIRACPLCDAEDLRVSKDYFVTLGIRAESGAPDLGTGSLLVRIRCGVCAHVLFFHAKQMGLG